MNLNPRKIPVGDIAYYVHYPYDEYHGVRGDTATVNFAVVVDHYTNAVVLQKYEPYKNRIVDGVPERELFTPTKWRKLPKDWNYSTMLFEITYDEDKTAKGARRKVMVDNKDGIKELIKNGYLVPFEVNDHCVFETQITKDGWRIVRNYGNKNHFGIFTKRPHEIYPTYEEANAEVKAYKAELLRIANLSDYDWSVEQIDKDIARIVNATPEERERYRKFLLSQDNVENIETRIFGGQLQWKYCKNKRWLNIEL